MNRNDLDYLVAKKNANMVCRYCNKHMILDDMDFRFKGCYDSYFLCEHCNSTCILSIRFNMPYKELWSCYITD